MNACILVRVSTKKQETARQLSELQAVATARGWTVVEVCEETISGRSDDRPGLRRVEELAQAGKIKKVLVHEVSRIGRKSSIVHAFIERLDDLGVSLYWHAQRIETLMENGKRNPAAGIMLALLAEMARAEVETLRERINSGLDEARRQGVKLGRPKGLVSVDATLERHADVVRGIRRGESIRAVASLTGKSTATVRKVADLMKGGAE